MESSCNDVLSLLLLSVRHPGSGEDEVPELRLVVLGAELVAEHPHGAVRVGVDAGAGLGLVDALQRSSWSRDISLNTEFDSGSPGLAPASYL